MIVHPETWKPFHSVSTILISLLSFMLEDEHTVGSVTTTYSQKRMYAKKSLGYNTKVKDICF